MENILLTFTGFQDPYAHGLIGEEEQPGPILSLLANKSFDRVVLFSTPRTEKNTSATAETLKKLYPRLALEVVDFPLEDPTDYLAILRGLRKETQTISEKTPKAQFSVSVSSGTPQMHACWVLLAACGEIPAHIINVRPQRFVSKERPLITEADLTAPEFPIVSSQLCRIEETPAPLLAFEDVARKLGIVGDHPSMRRALEMGSALAPSTAPILILGETGTNVSPSDDRELRRFRHFYLSYHQLRDAVSPESGELSLHWEKRDSVSPESGLPAWFFTGKREVLKMFSFKAAERLVTTRSIPFFCRN